VPSKDPIQRFEDILENVARIEKFTAGMDSDAFMGDPKTYDAVERCLERISEAATKLDKLADNLCPNIPWALIRGVGNRLRHEYDRIDGVRIWFMVERDLAPLKAAVQAALKQLKEDEGQADT
jgi:uncharacterized protein with HEPN domain